MRRMAGLIEAAGKRYDRANIREFARLASVQEAECYEVGERGLRTNIPRIEEIMQFAAKCGYSRIGLAFCIGLKNEARQVTAMFENNGFEMVSVGCKVGRTPKETIGVSGGEKIAGPDRMESMCNPIVQAEVLDAEEVDFAVLLGLCVGHDTLFLKYCRTPATVLAVKDRVTGHNPLAALYLSKSPYYRRLVQPRRSRGIENWKKVDITVED
jgi:uncharacterized metal-binding protein